MYYTTAMERELVLTQKTTLQDVRKISPLKDRHHKKKYRGKHRSHVKGAGTRDFYGITFRRGSGQRQIENAYYLDSLIQNFEETL